MNKLTSLVVFSSLICLSFPFSLIGQTLDLQLVEGSSVTVNPNSIVYTSVSCPSGYKVVSGGWDANGGSDSQLIVSRSVPYNNELDDWIFRFRNDGESATTVNPFIVCVRLTTTTVSKTEFGPPERPQLGQNYPNPFNPSTTFEYALNTQSNVRVEVFNQAGQLITTLVDGVIEAGNYQVTWNGKSSSGTPVSSGTYFYRLVNDGIEQTKKMVILR